MRMMRISSALFIVAMAVAACGPQSAGTTPAPPADTTSNDTVTDTLSLE